MDHYNPEPERPDSSSLPENDTTIPQKELGRSGYTTQPLSDQASNQGYHAEGNENSGGYEGQQLGTPFINQSTGQFGQRKSGRVGLLGTLLVLALLIGCLVGWAIGRATTYAEGVTLPASNAAPGTVTQVAEKFRTSVVQINVQFNQGVGLGSGVIIDPRGYIVTNNHVVAGEHAIQVVLYDNTKLTAQVTGADPADDLAIVKINPPRGMTVAKIGDSKTLQIGQPVLAIGNPLGITQTVTSGIVSALGRNISEGQNKPIIMNAIQTDAAINPGNSGGALVNLNDELIGIPTLVPIDPEFKTPAIGVGFAIPSNRVKYIANQLINKGHVTNSGRADLGVQVISVNSSIASQLHLPVSSGAMVVDVVTNSAAEKGGIRQGDIITQVDATKIDSVETLRDLLLSKNPGTMVTVYIYRNTQQQTLRVKLGELQVTGTNNSTS